MWDLLNECTQHAREKNRWWLLPLLAGLIGLMGLMRLVRGAGRPRTVASRPARRVRHVDTSLWTTAQTVARPVSLK